MLRLADWMADLGPYPNHDILLTHDVGVKELPHIDGQLISVFRSVHTLTIADDTWQKWPHSPNHAFRKTAKHIEFTMPQPWLWLEPDAVPLRKDWLDAIEAEYKSIPKDKKFLGDFVHTATTIDHMSGVAVYSGDITYHAGKALTAHDVAFDVMGADQILPKMVTSKLICHQWKRPPFTAWWEFRKEVLTGKPGCAIYHQDKTGALYPLLREQIFPVPVLAERAVVGKSNGEDREVAQARESTSHQATAVSRDSRGGELICDILIKTYPKDYEWLSYVPSLYRQVRERVSAGAYCVSTRF